MKILFQNFSNRFLVYFIFVTGLMTLSMSAYAETLKKYSVALKWGSAPNAEIYILQIFSGNKSISENRVKGNEYSISLEPNRYTYRIRSEDRLGQQGNWSSPKELIVRPPPPELLGVQLKEIIDQNPTTEAILKWRSDDAKKFIVKVWDQQKVIFEKNVNDQELKHTFNKAGNYFYSVASVVNQLPSEFSQRKEFQVKITELPFLKITAPKEGSTNAGPDVTLRWSSTRPVDRYLVKIFRFNNQTGRYEHWSDEWTHEKNAYLSLFGGKYTVQIIPYGKGENNRLRTHTAGKFEVLSSAMPSTVYSAGLGVSQLSYKETAVSDYSAIVLTPKFAVTYRLSPRFDLGFSTYFTAYTLSKNLAGYSMRFLGLNARLGYFVSGLPPDWNLALMGGGYFTTTLVTGNFGFQNLIGIQFTPRLLKNIGISNSIFTYAKLAPVTDGLSSLSLSNRETAFGVGWNHLYPNKRSISFTLDIALLALNFVTSLGKTYAIESQSITLGVGTNW